MPTSGRLRCLRLGVLVCDVVVCVGLAAQTSPNIRQNIPTVGMSPSGGMLMKPTFPPDDSLAGRNSHSLKLKNLNSMQFADQFAGATIDIQLNACIAAVIVQGGGVCDAIGLKSGTIAAQVDVGSNANPNAGVALLLPKVGTWSVAMNNPAACGVMLHDKSTVLGRNGQGNGNLMVIRAASSATSVMGLVCTDPSPLGGAAYIRAEGFAVSNTVGATMARGALAAQHLFDNSVFRDIDVAASSGIGAQVIDACCGTAFYNFLADGLSGAGAKPLVIGNARIGGPANGGLMGVGFFGLSATHPGAGQNAINITATQWNDNIAFYNLYMEPNPTDTSTPLVEIGANAHGIQFYLFTEAGVIARGSTAYMVDVATWSGPTDDVFIGGKQGHSPANIVNDHVTGVTILGSATYGQAGPYISGVIRAVGLPLTIASGTAAMTTAEISAGACATTVTVAATGVLTTDVINVSHNATVTNANGGTLILNWWPTAGSVNFNYCNPSPRTVTPSPMTVNWMIVR